MKPSQKRVRIIGNHPWCGESGTVIGERDMGIAGPMVEVELDRTEGIGRPSSVLAGSDELRALPKDEDPFR